MTASTTSADKHCTPSLPRDNADPLAAQVWPRSVGPTAISSIRTNFEAADSPGPIVKSDERGKGVSNTPRRRSGWHVGQVNEISDNISLPPSPLSPPLPPSAPRWISPSLTALNETSHWRETRSPKEVTDAASRSFLFPICTGCPRGTDGWMDGPRGRGGERESPTPLRPQDGRARLRGAVPGDGKQHV